MELEKTTEWRILSVLQEAAAFLERSGIESPRLNAERLLAFMLSLSRVDLYLRFEHVMSGEERNRYKTLLRRRAGHEPLQYILGETEFMSLSFRVNPSVLIPRPETEVLVEEVIRRAGNKPVRILDIGTGSGCMAVSVAHSLPESTVLGVDLDDSALAVAEENATRHGVNGRVRFFNADLRDPSFLVGEKESFDILISNPPYVSPDQWDGLDPEIRNHEPRHALCDEKDGLEFYRLLAARVSSLLKPGGCFCFEIGHGQSEAVKTLFSKNSHPELNLIRDLNGIPRVIAGLS